MSKIEDAVARRIIERAAEGKRKYGVTMERSDLNLNEWLQHLQEELMDACVYVEKLRQEVQYQEFELAEKRMEIIGRNGNTGEHYDIISGTEAAYARKYGPCSSHAFYDEEKEEN